MSLDELIDRGLRREPRALGRLLSRVEDGGAPAAAILDRVYGRGGAATTIGLTGPPGAGKSTLTSVLVAHYRDSGRRVAVVAVDPTSPFTGGALLGDRIRMAAHFEDPDVYIRSMATRGQFGGLAAATADVVDVLDAAGYDVVIVETIGVGQDDVAVASLVGTCVLVLTPGQGDEIQALKSGVMEIGDLYAINKADLDGVERLETGLRSVLSIEGLEGERPIVRTIATAGTGIADLASAIDATSVRLGADKMTARATSRARQRVAMLVDAGLRRIAGEAAIDDLWASQCALVRARELAPQRAATVILDEIRSRTRA